MWIVDIKAVYETEEEAKEIQLFLKNDYQYEIIKGSCSVIRTGTTINIKYHYEIRSKYLSVRPAIEMLNTIFDPIARDDYYRPWPKELNVWSYGV